MDADKLKAILAAMAAHDVTELELGDGTRIVRKVGARPIQVEDDAPPARDLDPVVIPWGAPHIERAVQTKHLDDVEAELDRMGA